MLRSCGQAAKGNSAIFIYSQEKRQLAVQGDLWVTRKSIFYTKGRGKKAFWTLWSLFLLCLSLNICVSVGLSCRRIWPKSTGPKGLCNCLGCSVQGFWHTHFQSGAESFALRYPVLHAFRVWMELKDSQFCCHWQLPGLFSLWLLLLSWASSIYRRGCAFGPAVLVGTPCSLEPSQSHTHLLPSALMYFQLS